jgi:O-antigen ligase
VGSDVRFVRQFLAASFLVGMGMVLLGVPDLFGDQRLRVFGQNTIQTGQITMITGLVALFWILRSGPALVRVAAALVIPVAFIEAIASGSRGPVLAFAVVLLYQVLHRMRTGPRLGRRDVQVGLVFALALGGLALVFDQLPGSSLSRFELFADGLGSVDSSAQARVNLFDVALAMFAQQPVFGHGTGAFAAFAQTHVGLIDFYYPHNILLQTGAELGVVGLAALLAFVTVALVRRIPDDPAWGTIRAVAVFQFVNSLVSGDLYSDRLLWGLLVMLVAAPSASQGERAHPGLPPRLPNGRWAPRH